MSVLLVIHQENCFRTITQLYAKYKVLIQTFCESCVGTGVGFCHLISKVSIFTLIDQLDRPWNKYYPSKTLYYNNYLQF